MQILIAAACQMPVKTGKDISCDCNRNFFASKWTHTGPNLSVFSETYESEMRDTQVDGSLDTWMERDNLSEVSCLKSATQCPQPGYKPGPTQSSVQHASY